jgi:hypothetical protein
MSRTPRFAFVLVLGLLLTAPPSWAGGPSTRHAAPDGLTRFWSLLTGLWADAGCIIDPHGCVTGQAPAALPQLDEGCAIDPHGCLPGHASTPLRQTDAGCALDPHGGCLPG